MENNGFFKDFLLERFFAKWEFVAKWLLCASDCESMTVGELLALEPGSEERFYSLGLGYTDMRGSPGLRSAIAARYDSPGESGILVHSGAEEAILNFCLAFLSPGDRVICNVPCYQSLLEVPRALGCEIVPWKVRVMEEGDSSGRWYFDPDDLSRLLEKPARLVIMNAPHNPTGALPTNDEFKAIVDAARKAGTVLFVDEVYRGIEHGEGRTLPAVADMYESGVSLDVLSKTHGLPGLRIGWLASRRTDILDRVASQKDYNSICSSAPSEFLAGIALAHSREIVSARRDLCSRNLSLLDSFFSRHPGFARWNRPEGGSIGFPRLTDSSDAEPFAETLVAESGVLLLPGSYYGYDKSHFRIGYGRANMDQCLSRLESWLDTRHGS